MYPTSSTHLFKEHINFGRSFLILPKHSFFAGFGDYGWDARALVRGELRITVKLLGSRQTVVSARSAATVLTPHLAPPVAAAVNAASPGAPHVRRTDLSRTAPGRSAAERPGRTWRKVDGGFHFLTGPAGHPRRSLGRTNDRQSSCSIRAPEIQCTRVSPKLVAASPAIGCTCPWTMWRGWCSSTHDAQAVEADVRRVVGVVVDAPRWAVAQQHVGGRQAPSQP